MRSSAEDVAQILADHVPHAGIAKRAPIGLAGGRLDDVTPARHPVQGAIEEGVRIGREQALRQVRLLGEQEPVEVPRGEAMVDAYVFDEIIKYVTLRERPKQDNARGDFFTGNASSDPSFVSGHSIVAWSSAAVLAEEYHRP